ncbi:uncharacterized protein LOC133355041 [Lethenteron reissneri]|uniref:uncharacterized protein LOC133355041 n=1 Tax=Lethenteron reissneri TaxID=7753 RepID=UPI002AB7602E|nr:uncharacterized protein LOC133355041 [Lethenteron reissneri]
MSEELFVQQAKGTCGDGEMWPEVTVKIEKDSSANRANREARRVCGIPYAVPRGVLQKTTTRATRGRTRWRPVGAAEWCGLRGRRWRWSWRTPTMVAAQLWDGADTLGAVTKTRVWWSDAETRVLLKLIQDINVGTILDGKRQRNAAVFKKIQRELSLRGVEKNWEAARWKWKALKAKYIAAKRAMGRNGAGTWTNFRFYSDMDKILGGRPNALRASAHLQGTVGCGEVEPPLASREEPPLASREPAEPARGRLDPGVRDEGMGPSLAGGLGLHTVPCQTSEVGQSGVLAMASPPPYVGERPPSRVRAFEDSSGGTYV